MTGIRCGHSSRAVGEIQGATEAEMTDRFYQSRAWRNLRDAHAREHPYCEPCLRLGMRVSMDIVDHKLPRLKFPALELTPSNLESQCRSCHKRKTDRDMGRRTSAPKVGCDVHGNPIGGWK